MSFKSGHFFKRLLLFLLLIFTSCVSFHFMRKQDSLPSNYKGKILYKVTISGEMGGDIEVPEIYINGNWLFERVYFLRWNGMDSATGKIVPYGPGDPRSRTLTGYYVTDFSKGVVFEFDSSAASPQLVKSFPILEKKIGLHLVKEMKEIQDALGGFNNIGDTIINGIRYKVLADPNSRVFPGGFTLEKSIAYLNPGIKNFPIKISSYLDKKFDGWVSRISLFAKKDTLTSTTTIDISYIEGLNLVEEQLMDKYVKLVKTHNNPTGN